MLLHLSYKIKIELGHKSSSYQNLYCVEHTKLSTAHGAPDTSCQGSQRHHARMQLAGGRLARRLRPQALLVRECTENTDKPNGILTEMEAKCNGITSHLFVKLVTTCEVQDATSILS